MNVKIFDATPGPIIPLGGAADFIGHGFEFRRTIARLLEKKKRKKGIRTGGGGTSKLNKDASETRDDSITRRWKGAALLRQ